MIVNALFWKVVYLVMIILFLEYLFDKLFKIEFEGQFKFC